VIGAGAVCVDKLRTEQDRHGGSVSACAPPGKPARFVAAYRLCA
jgi:hypothetical protein